MCRGSSHASTPESGMARRGLFPAVCVALLLSPAGGLDLSAAPPGVPPRGAVAAAQTAFATARGARLRSPRHSAWCAARRPGAAVLNMSGKDGMEKFIDRMLDKLEAKSKKKWDKVCAKTERFQARVARLMGSSSSIQPVRMFDCVGPIAVGLCALCVPHHAACALDSKCPHAPFCPARLPSPSLLCPLLAADGERVPGRQSWGEKAEIAAGVGACDRKSDVDSVVACHFPVRTSGALNGVWGGDRGGLVRACAGPDVPGDSCASGHAPVGRWHPVVI